MKSTLLGLIVTGLLVNIANAQNLDNSTTVNAPFIEVEDHPTIGQVNEVYLGDQMLRKRFGHYGYCITPKFDYNQRIAGSNYEIRGGVALCNNEILFSDPTRPDISKALNATFKPSYDNVDWGDGKGSYAVFFKEKKGIVTPRINGWNLKKKMTIEEFGELFSVDLIYVISENQSQQVVEYAGKNGSILKFTYSELEGGLAREAFTRDFQIDLNEGNVGAYKGAVFEVVDASNATIKYKVIRHFP